MPPRRRQAPRPLPADPKQSLAAQAARISAVHAACPDAGRPWSAAELADLLDQPGVLSIERAGAFLIARSSADETEILMLAVHPDQRRRGLGRELLTELISSHLKEEGFQIFLEVADDNLAARALYEAAGFSVAGRRKGYYARQGASNVDAIVLSRAIESRN